MASNSRKEIKIIYLVNKMLRKFKFDYDLDNDSLYMYDSKSKSKASIEIDDMIIDFNNKKEVSGIELLNASEFFNDLKMHDFQVNKEILDQITSCNIDIIPKGSFFVIKFMLTFKTNQTLETPVYIPTIHEPSPAVAKMY
jgi:uncharacterized protein YuzE